MSGVQSGCAREYPTHVARVPSMGGPSNHFTRLHPGPLKHSRYPYYAHRGLCHHVTRGALPNAADTHVAALVADFHAIWTDSVPQYIARLALHLSQARKRFLRELGVLPPSRVSRMGLRPNG